MTVSAIIPVLNGEEDIANCLQHLVTELQPHEEIIVVDNGSTDNTHNIVRSFDKVKLLIHPEVTIAALRNRGVEQSTGDICAFIDSDVIVCSGWRDAIVKQFEDQQVGGTGSICALPENPTWVEKAWFPSRKQKPHAVNYIPSGNLVFRASEFKNLNGFDERLETDEDCDLCERLVSTGKLLINDPKVEAIHLGNAKTIGDFFKRQKWHAKSIYDSVTWTKPDKATIMTIMFAISMLLIAFLPMILSKPIETVIAISFSLFWVPTITALFRVLQYRNPQFFLSLIILYTIFYIVRIISGLEYLIRKINGNGQTAS